jgi:hypothetical protein
MVDRDKDIPCKMQRDILVPVSWCQQAQRRDLCRGCRWNQGRNVSRWQESKKEARDDECGNKV